MIEDGNATGTSTQSHVFKTVQMNRAVNFDTTRGLNSDEVLSQLQVVSSGGGEPFLRLQKNNITYDLTKSKAVVLLY